MGIIQNNKLIFTIIFFSLLVIVGSNLVFARIMYYPYTPTYSSDDIKNVSLSGCAPPETVSGCAACYEGFKQDCVYYNLNSPEQCSVVYSEQREKESCYYFVFREKVKQSDAIISTCKLFEKVVDQDMCFMSLVPYYGETSSICSQITVDPNARGSYKDTCIMDYALEKQDPFACGDLRWVDSMIECCTGAKGIKEQYITTRKDLIDNFVAKYGKEVEQCKQLLTIKSEETVDACEDLNCECLSPCNKLSGDAAKQQDCAIDCAYKYVTCYGAKKTDMPQVSRERFMQQSFYGQFSRKHCAEYKGSLAATLKKDDHTEKKEPDTCTSNDQCSDKRLCDACGKCRDEKELVLNTNVNVSFSINPENEELTLKNDFTETGVFRVKVTPSFKEKTTGKKFDYCDLTYPGIKQDVKLIATNSMPNELIFSGFTTGQLNDPRDISARCTIDLKQPEKTCAFIVSPNDKKKPVGLVNEVNQYFDLGLMGYLESNTNQAPIVLGMEKAALKLTLTPTNYPKINFKMSSYQMQQGTSRAIKFTVDDTSSNLIMVNVKVIGPATIFDEGKEDIDLRSLHFTAKPNEEVQIGIKAPEMGNFDIGTAMNSLSMVNLQKEAGKQFLADAAFAYADSKLEKLTDGLKAASEQEKMALELYQGYLTKYPNARTADKTARFVMNAKRSAQFEKDVNTMVNTYKLGKGVINDLPGINSAIKGSQEDVAGNLEQSDPDSKASTGVSTTEKAANIGVTVINLAQLGVGVVTFVPNKIPGVNKLTSGFQAAFSAATNIWKANLKYIAQAEKIDRAEEIFVPVMVVVTAEDLSGWQAQSAVMMQIAYHKV